MLTVGAAMRLALFALLADPSSSLRTQRHLISLTRLAPIVIPSSYRRTGSALLGYLAPELDPEFNKDASTRSLQLDLNATLPSPREGDIVRCAEAWGAGGKGWEDHKLARLRFLRYDGPRERWIADVTPLVEGKSDKVFAVDKNAKSFFQDVAALQPVQAFFLRSENGYKVAMKRNSSTEVVLKAAAYRELARDFVPPALQKVDQAVLRQDMDTYAELKNRIIKTTLVFGAVGSIVCVPLFGFDVAIPYASGATAGGLYLYLLGKKIDGIGLGFSAGNSSYSKLDNVASNLRLLVPVALMAGLAARNAASTGVRVSGLSSLSRDQFLAAAAGFLTYRLAIFVSEIASEVRTEDWLSMMPGSAAEMYRQAQKLPSLNEQSKPKSDMVSTVVLLTGPKAAGRSGVLEFFVSRAAKASKKKTLRYVRFLTTDTAAWQRQPARYSLVTTEQLEELRAKGELIYEAEERSASGLTWSVALTTDQLTAASVEETLVIDGPPALMDSLSKVSSIKLINVWISLQTKEQFIERATEMVKSELPVTAVSASVADRVNEVSALVDAAASDITYYMQKAPRFDFTLLNAGTDEETADELSQILLSAL